MKIVEEVADNAIHSAKDWALMSWFYNLWTFELEDNNIHISKTNKKEIRLNQQLLSSVILGVPVVLH